MKEITESMLDGLRGKLMEIQSPKRFRHTVAVEDMTRRLCALFCPDLTTPMRAAALLHDITKELDAEAQIALCESYGLSVSEAERCSPKTLHARSAAEKILREMPEFSDPIIVGAVRYHTTGHADMTLTEKILYLADYIDDSRTFQNCVLLRRYFFGAEPEKLTMDARLSLLRETLILSYDFTIRDLLADGKSVAMDTVLARNDLILERHREG